MIMKFSRLTVALTCLVASLGGDVDCPTIFQEDFCGHHNLSTAMLQAGLPILARDTKFSRNLNNLTGIGMMATLQGLRTLCQGGLAWFGIPCSSCVYMSRGSTRRSRLNARGCRSYASVRQANAIARRDCYLVHYVEQKGAFWCLDNPVSSLVWLYKPVADMLRRPGVHCV